MHNRRGHGAPASIAVRPSRALSAFPRRHDFKRTGGPNQYDGSADDSDLLVMEDFGDFADFLAGRSPALLAKKTWSVLAVSLLIHSFFIGMLWVCGKPALEARHIRPPDWIDAQLVSLAGDPEEPEAGPAAGPADPAPQPAVETPPLAPPPVPIEKKKTEPPKNLAKAPARIEKPERPVPRRDEQAKPAPPSPGPNDGMESPGAGASQPAVQSGAGEGSGGSQSAWVKADMGEAVLLKRRLDLPEGPSFLHREMPSYPALAKRMEKEGSVLLRVTIDERGKPVDVEVVNKAGFGFDEEAVRAVKNSTFVPARREGRPLTCKALLPIRFVLKGS